ADQLRPKLAKLAALMDEAETDVLAFMSFPKDHRLKIHSTNPLERLNGEVKRRTEVLGIFPTLEDKIVQGAVAEVLSAIYEVDFLGFSYGFRPGRNPFAASST